MNPRPAPGAPVTAVLFDYGLTLTTFTRPVDALQRAYSRIAAMLPTRAGNRPWDAAELLDAVHDRVDARVAENDASGNLEEIDIHAAHRDAYAALGLSVEPEVIDRAMRIEQEAWWEGVHVAPDVPATLEALRRRGLRLGLCSNAAYPARSMHDQLAHLGLRPLLDAATFSSEVGWRKPSPRIFAAALAALGAEPATTVMIGDRVRQDVEGAHAMGMRAVRLREHDNDVSPGDRPDAVLDRLADLPALIESAAI